jgi:two-component system OmpR family sensor kinase
MSSSRSRRPADRHRLAGWPLRTRLIVAMIGLLALICVTFGLTSVFFLRQSLIGQVDRQLDAAQDRAHYMPNGASFGGRGGDDLSQVLCQNPFPPGQPTLTFSACVSGGTVSIAQILVGDPRPSPVNLSSDYYQMLLALPTDGRKYSRSLGDFGDYRLTASRVPGGNVVIITGLPLADQEATLVQLTIVEVSVAAAGLILAGSAGAVIIRRSLRPLRRVAATATRVSELPLDRGEVALSVRVPAMDTDPRTEVGQVGAALNRMLGHIGRALAARQASETRLRQFVADASHELRTPLAAIRGYAELARRVQDEVPADVAHAMRRVESESARMTTLVEDLLLLARLDSGRPLEREPVDLSRLVVDAIGDAHVAGPGHNWRLDLPEEPVTVVGDEARVHQVLANLLANARTHTPTGTTVVVALSQPDPAHAVLRVTDDGPGIPPALLPDVFDRFARADTSRSRAAGSTGLGLSIVAAVVQAHDGTVEVASKPGYTEFTVTLPAAPA